MAEVVELEASTTIEDRATSYGLAVVRNKFPHRTDGLILVARRALWANRHLTGKFTGATMQSNTMEWHPHGDTSTYAACAHVSQPFRINPTLFDFTSSSGTYNKAAPPQARYGEFVNSEISKDLFFRSTDIGSLPKVINDASQKLEPIHFIPAIPTALLYATLAVGFGYQSKTVALNLDNVCELTCAYIEHWRTNPLKPFDHTKHLTKFLPDFPLWNYLLNADELIEAYRQGNFKAKILLEGDVVLSKDKIIIHTLPYGSRFAQARELLLESRKKKKFAVDKYLDRNIKGVSNFSSKKNYGHLEIELTRGANVFEVWDVIRNMVGFNDTYAPSPIYASGTDDISELDYVGLIQNWFMARVPVVDARLRHDLEKVYRELQYTKALLLICDDKDKVIEIIKRSAHNEVEAALSAEFPTLTLNQAQYLANTPMRFLSKTSREVLEPKLKAQEEQFDSISVSFHDIPNIILREVRAIQSKYLKLAERKTIIPKYIGFVKIEDGYHQFETVDDVTDILDRFPGVPVMIYLYHGRRFVKLDKTGKVTKESLFRVGLGEIYGFKQNPEDLYTVNISDGTGCAVKGFIPAPRSAGYLYTTRRSFALLRDGTLLEGSVTDFLTKRQTISKGAKTDIVHIYPYKAKTHYVVTMNDTSQNLITLHRVDVGSSDTGGTFKGKLLVSPMGNLYCMSFPIGSEIYVNIPEECTTRKSVRALYIDDAEKILGDQQKVQIDINSSKWRNNKNVRYL